MAGLEWFCRESPIRDILKNILVVWIVLDWSSPQMFTDRLLVTFGIWLATEVLAAAPRRSVGVSDDGAGSDRSTAEYAGEPL
jgi:hypothetical protein